MGNALIRRRFIESAPTPIIYTVTLKSADGQSTIDSLSVNSGDTISIVGVWLTVMGDESSIFNQSTPITSDLILYKSSVSGELTPFAPGSVDYSESTGISNPEFAFDNDSNTRATVSYSGNSLVVGFNGATYNLNQIIITCGYGGRANLYVEGQLSDGTWVNLLVGMSYTNDAWWNDEPWTYTLDSTKTIKALRIRNGNMATISSTYYRIIRISGV